MIIFREIKNQETHDNTDEKMDFESKCNLCLGIRKESTSTICGHVFCLNCITEWNKNKVTHCFIKLEIIQFFSLNVLYVEVHQN